MFGSGPFQNDEEEDNKEKDGFGGLFEENQTNREKDESGQFGGERLGGEKLPWEELPEEDAEKIRQESETPMCEHDSNREVITKQAGGGVQLAGWGGSRTTTVTKVVCPTCGGEWDTWDGSNQSGGRDPFNL